MSDRIYLNAGGRGMQLTIAIAALLTAAAGFVFGAPALIDTAAGANVPVWAQPLSPVILDAIIVVAAGAVFVSRSHQRDTRLEFATLAGLTALSAGIQFLHAWNATEGMTLVERMPALAIATLPPIAMLLGTEIAAKAVLVEKVPRGRKATAGAVKGTNVTATKPTEVTGHGEAEVTTPTGPNETKPTGPNATKPTAVTAASDRPAPTMSRDEAAAAFIEGTMSKRDAAEAAGVSGTTILNHAKKFRESQAAA